MMMAMMMTIPEVANIKKCGYQRRCYVSLLYYNRKEIKCNWLQQHNTIIYNYNYRIADPFLYEYIVTVCDRVFVIYRYQQSNIVNNFKKKLLLTFLLDSSQQTLTLTWRRAGVFYWLLVLPTLHSHCTPLFVCYIKRRQLYALRVPLNPLIICFHWIRPSLSIFQYFVHFISTRKFAFAIYHMPPFVQFG